MFVPFYVLAAVLSVIFLIMWYSRNKSRIARWNIDRADLQNYYSHAEGVIKHLCCENMLGAGAKVNFV